MDAEKHNLFERFLRFDATFTDPEKHTLLERVFWAIPPVLIAFMLIEGVAMLLLTIVSRYL
jgi:hypothetical protein